MKKPTSKSSVKEVVEWLKDARATMRAQDKELQAVHNKQCSTSAYAESYKLEMKLSSISRANFKLIQVYKQVLNKHIDRILEVI